MIYMKISQMDEEQLRRLAEVMKAMAHPVRLRILCHLRREPCNVGQLQEILGKDQPMVSQQLRILRLNGLVDSQRREGHVYYSLEEEKSQFIERILGSLCGCL